MCLRVRVVVALWHHKGFSVPQHGPGHTCVLGGHGDGMFVFFPSRSVEPGFEKGEPLGAATFEIAHIGMDKADAFLLVTAAQDGLALPPLKNHDASDCS